jgi:archaellin
MAEDFVLEANKGYILGLDLDYMEYDNTAFWANNISNVELYFPSQTTISSIKQTEVTIPALGEEYRCTINRGTSEGDRRIKDSFWRCIGVPSYNEFAGEVTSGKGGSTINWQTSYSTFPFLYAWNMSDNTLTPQNTSTFAFKPMHAYLVQIQDAIYWNMVSATPSPIVARRERAEHETEHNWCLTLSKDSSFVDQTYVRMSNLEQVTNSFDFNQDLIKEMNASRSNIYTLVGYERLAANSMPIEFTNTTIIPVGVNIKTTGEYTFAMPEGTNGVGITLVDTETNVRTSLSAFNYTVNLNAGQYDSRFILEISPISQTTTGVEEINDPSSNVRKLMIDGILYIIHEGKMYDARGARVE